MAHVWIVSFAFLIALHAQTASSMDIERHGEQLVLSGPVVSGDAASIRQALGEAPGITTVLLRNSDGGDARTGYQVGELFRQLGLTTAVSGYCISSCSRMFLGGATRAFTDDYPAEQTKIGFHGHYDAAGRLQAEAVERLGLKDWILQYTGGKADPLLVDRWINIPQASGAAYFFPPQVSVQTGNSAFFCSGAEVVSIFQCEPIHKSALDMGVVTTEAVVTSNDRREVQAALQPPLPSGFADLADLDHLPLSAERGRAEYRRFLLHAAPRAFAIASDGQHWAWKSGAGDAMAEALQRCRSRAPGQSCQLYAVNDQVVWRTPLEQKVSAPGE